MRLNNLYIKEDKSLFWFRIFKQWWGIHGKDVRKNVLLFSERNNLDYGIIIGNWRFKILKPYILNK